MMKFFIRDNLLIPVLIFFFLQRNDQKGCVIDALRSGLKAKSVIIDREEKAPLFF